MNNNKAFLYTVNLYNLSQNFKESGMGDKYYEYHSKDFYGAVIRSPRPLQELNGDIVVVMPHPRFSDGSFKGVNIDIIPRDDSRLYGYQIDPADLLHAYIIVEKNPGNIVINDKAALTSLFFHDHQEKQTTIINIVARDGAG